MMTLHTFKGFVDGARDAYLHAVDKHPHFTDKVTHHSKIEISDFLAFCRNFNDVNTPNFESIINEEISEYIEATLTGDREAAKRELLDCVAVLMREWERISQ